MFLGNYKLKNNMKYLKIKLSTVRVIFLLFIGSHCTSNAYGEEVFDAIPGGIDLPLKYSVSITYSLRSYIYKKNSDETKNEEVISDGLDFSGTIYLNKWIGYELGMYYGKGTELSIGEFGDKVSFRLSDRTDMDSVSVMGIRNVVLAGWNIRDPGFRAYLGVGLFAENAMIEKTNDSKFSDQLIGASLKFGLGYSWRKVAFGFWGSVGNGQVEGFEKGTSQGGWVLTYNI